MRLRMAKPLPSLDWSLIRSFLAVAETGSLSGAARSLGLTQPSVGRQVRAFETRLGLSLFTRQRRGMALTDAGAALLTPAQAMRDAAGRLALNAAGQEEGLSGTVRLTASEVVAHHHLPRILAAIRAAEPGIALELVASDRSDNLLFREADIAIRMYRPEQLDIVAKHLGTLPIGVYAAKSYLDRRGRPRTPADLRDHTLIGLDRNEVVLRAMRTLGLEAEREWFALRCDDHPVNWELVRAGCGIGFVQVAVAEADPTVERLLADLPLPALPMWLTAPEAMRRSPRIRRVWDLLEQHLAPLTGDRTRAPARQTALSPR